jgi:hypothetical protein
MSFLNEERQQRTTRSSKRRSDERKMLEEQDEDETITSPIPRPRKKRRSAAKLTRDSTGPSELDNALQSVDGMVPRVAPNGLSATYVKSSGSRAGFADDDPAVSSHVKAGPVNGDPVIDAHAASDVEYEDFSDIESVDVDDDDIVEVGDDIFISSPDDEVDSDDDGEAYAESSFGHEQVSELIATVDNVCVQRFQRRFRKIIDGLARYAHETPKIILDGQRAMSFGFWSLIGRASMDFIMDMHMDTIPHEAQSVLGKETWAWEDFLSLPDNCLLDTRKGIYANFPSEVNAAGRMLCECYVGSSRKSIKSRVGQHHLAVKRPKEVSRQYRHLRKEVWCQTSGLWLPSTPH